MARDNFVRSNPYPPQKNTHQRQQGDSNTPAVGEQHDNKKAQTIPQERRWDRAAQAIEAPDGE